MRKISAPKAKRLPSGSWMCRVTAQGDSKCFTGPVKSEVEAQALEYKITHQARPLAARTVGDAVERYIRSREKVLSPATIRGYEQIKRNYFLKLQGIPLKSLTRADCQAAIADETDAHSAKSICNAWGLFSPALIAAGFEDFPVRLPQKVVADTPWLDPEQLPVFLDAVKGHRMEAYALLALHSLRNSEILDLTWGDVDLQRGLIYVRGAAVPDKNGQLVHKAANKNTRSRRAVEIWLPRLTLLLQEQHKADGYVCPFGERAAYFAINRICKKAGLPEVGVHGLRRSFASLCYHLGVPERVAMQQGGWADAATMHKHYVKIAERDQQAAVESLRTFASGL